MLCRSAIRGSRLQTAGYPANHLEGWLLQDGRWWYLLSGYTYRHDAVCQIDGQAYAFDSDGWMITSDRIAEDGHIQ
ncbi:MAG: hypothetical protein ACLR8P_01370 [Clostridium fessum]